MHRDAPSLAEVVALVVECSGGRYGLHNVLDVWLWGSRVYGTNHAHSDWDFMVVVREDNSAYYAGFVRDVAACSKAEATLVRGRARTGTMVLDSGRLNVSVLREASWKRLVCEHRLEALEALWLAPQHVWLRSAATAEVARQWRPDPAVLRIAADFEAGRTFNKAAKPTLPEPKARKECFHALRYLLFAHQLAVHGRIVDYAAANGHWPHIRDAPSPFRAQEWSNTFRGLFHAFHAAVGAVAKFESCAALRASCVKAVGAPLISSSGVVWRFEDETFPLARVGSWDALEAHGFDARLFQVGDHCVVHVSGARIALSQCVRDLDPELSALARRLLCVVLVLVPETQSFRVVCSSAEARVGSSGQSGGFGLPVYAYSLHGLPLVATHMSPDGRELVAEVRATLLAQCVPGTVAWVEPRTRYGYRDETLSLAEQCCVGISVEIEDFVDALPPSEPLYTPALFASVYVCSPLRLCSRLVGEALPVEVMCAHWSHVAQQRDTLRAQVTRAVDAVCASRSDAYPHFGHVLAAHGRSALVVLLCRGGYVAKLMRLCDSSTK